MRASLSRCRCVLCPYVLIEIPFPREATAGTSITESNRAVEYGRGITLRLVHFPLVSPQTAGRREARFALTYSFEALMRSFVLVNMLFPFRRSFEGLAFPLAAEIVAIDLAMLVAGCCFRDRSLKIVSG